ncbi:MAG TPA: AIM24 family protein [Accumulibacter sp.]|nr:AIM24 family protein [Accumulibacter sp.]
MDGFDREAFETLETQERPGARFEILQYPALRGSADLAVAEKIVLLNQARIRLKMVRVTLDGGEVPIEPGALYFMKGRLRLESGLAGGLAKSLLRKFATGETLFQSTIGGTGEVYLEPSFGHRAPFDLERDAPVFDRGAFCCAGAGIAVSARLQKTLSGALFGGEGFFQTAAEGSGARVRQSPVPASELLTYDLAGGEKLSVDGNFAFARSASVQFQAEKSAKSWLQTATGGELLLQTFTGPGRVWLAPTQGVYDRIARASGDTRLDAAPDSRGTTV